MTDADPDAQDREIQDLAADMRVWFPLNRGGFLYAASGSVSAVFS